MSSGISVHPSTAASTPRLLAWAMTSLKYDARRFLEPPIHELVEDHSVDVHALVGGRYLTLDRARTELRRVHRPFHQVFRAEDQQTSKAALGGDARHLFSDMQPWHRRSIADEIDCLVGGVVRTNQELGAGLAKLLGRGKKHRRHFLPPSGVNVTHVGGKRIRMHRDLRVGVGSQDGGSLDAYRPIAERSTFRADGDDSYVLRHVLMPFFASALRCWHTTPCSGTSSLNQPPP